MPSSPDSADRLPVRKRMLGALAPLLPGAAAFRLLGLQAGEIHGDPRGQVAGYRAEPGPVGVLHRVPGGIAWGRGAHLDAGYRLIHALSPGINRGFDYWLRKRQRFLPRLITLPGETISLAADGQGNYFHWMTDVIPRLAAFEPNSLPQRHFLVAEETSFQRETLDLLGISPEHRTAIATRDFYSAPELLVPIAPPGVSREKVRLIRHLLLERTGLAEIPAARERIYISRRDASSRRMLNEAELDPILQRHQFRICHPEQLSLRQQILLFHGAETILAPHGAAWTNLVFVRAGTRALEIIPERLETERLPYAPLAALVDARYGRVPALSSGHGDPHTSDMRLEPVVLENLLRRLD